MRAAQPIDSPLTVNEIPAPTPVVKDVSKQESSNHATSRSTSQFNGKKPSVSQVSRDETVVPTSQNNLKTAASNTPMIISSKTVAINSES